MSATRDLMMRSSNVTITAIAPLLFILPALHPGAPGSRPEPQGAPYQDPSQPIATRVADLVSRMTLEEKVLQMQHTAPAIPRLGIPSYDWWNEALHGVARSGYATVFPQAIGMAATWDVDLIHQEAQAIATEARAKYSQAQRDDNHSIYYGLTFWSPNINIFRDPRWGRGQETYGEDPFLTSKLGVAFVTGLQGDDPKYFKVISTPKHYAVHSGPESERHRFNVNVAPDNEHGSAAAVRAGTDTTCGNEYVALVKAARDGLIKESEIDAAASRLFTARMRLGMFDPPESTAYNRVPMTELDSAEHRRLALQVARESMVLLT